MTITTDLLQNDGEESSSDKSWDAEEDGDNGDSDGDGNSDLINDERKTGDIGKRRKQ